MARKVSEGQTAQPFALGINLVSTLPNTDTVVHTDVTEMELDSIQIQTYVSSQPISNKVVEGDNLHSYDNGIANFD